LKIMICFGAMQAGIRPDRELTFEHKGMPRRSASGPERELNWSRIGFAARCEAGLCPAGSTQKKVGLCPWFGF
jgi:hypothetical protein